MVRNVTNEEFNMYLLSSNFEKIITALGKEFAIVNKYNSYLRMDDFGTSVQDIYISGIDCRFVYDGKKIEFVVYNRLKSKIPEVIGTFVSDECTIEKFKVLLMEAFKLSVFFDYMDAQANGREIVTYPFLTPNLKVLDVKTQQKIKNRLTRISNIITNCESYAERNKVAVVDDLVQNETSRHITVDPVVEPNTIPEVTLVISGNGSINKRDIFCDINTVFDTINNGDDTIYDIFATHEEYVDTDDIMRNGIPVDSIYDNISIQYFNGLFYYAHAIYALMLNRNHDAEDFNNNDDYKPFDKLAIDYLEDMKKSNSRDLRSIPDDVIILAESAGQYWFFWRDLSGKNSIGRINKFNIPLGMMKTLLVKTALRLSLDRTRDLEFIDVTELFKNDFITF